LVVKAEGSCDDAGPEASTDVVAWAASGRAIPVRKMVIKGDSINDRANRYVLDRLELPMTQIIDELASPRQL
jgi:hypothetical protein